VVHSLSIFLFPFFGLVYLFFFFSMFSMYCFLLIVIFGAASIDEPQGFSGSPPVAFSTYCKMYDYSGK